VSLPATNAPVSPPLGPAPERLTLPLAGLRATERLAGLLAGLLEPGFILFLSGYLGAGKTTFTRALLRALGVKSPTYTLIEPYVVSRLNLYHFDFYRFNSPEEYLDAGLDEYFADQGVCIVEWPQKALPHLPSPDLEIQLEVRDGGRFVEIYGRTDAGRTCVTELIKSLRAIGPTLTAD